MTWLISVVALIGSVAWANADVVLQAVPSQRVDAGPSHVSQTYLSEDAALEAVVIIDRQDDRYVWTSRDGKELVRVDSGIYTIFVAQSGAGYIKVERPLEEGKPFRFLEHVHLGLGTITYFGETSGFND